MKKILFIIPSFETGGTISSLTSLYNHLSSKYVINVFSMAFDGINDYPFKNNTLKRAFGIHAYNCSYTNAKGFEKVLILFVKIIKRICLMLNFDLESFIYKRYSSNFTDKYDIIIGFQEGNATRLASYLTATKKFAWVHCDYSRLNTCGKELPLYMCFDNIICVSSYTAQIFRDIYPSIKQKVSFIYNLLNIDQICLKSHEKCDDSFYITDDFTFLSVGRFADVKRFDKIPQIAHKIKCSGIKFKWYIIGPESEKETVQNFYNEMKKYGVYDSVYYLGNKSNPYPYFKKCNLLVCLSSSEACPMIFNESKIIGTPIITTNFPSSYEFITDGFDGRIVSIELLAETLKGIVLDSKLYNNFIENISSIQYNNRSTLENLYHLLDL